jgi:cell division protein FtsN
MGKDKQPKDATREAPTERGGDFADKRGPSGWPDMQGEGNRDAAREYNESQREFVESGQVDEAAREAEPRSDEERREMERAEREGRSHARK